MNPDPLTPLDYDRIWQDGYDAGSEGRPSFLWALLLGALCGAMVAFAFGFLVGHVSAAPRSAHLSAIPVVDDGRSGVPLVSLVTPTSPRVDLASPEVAAGGAPISGIASWYPARGLIAAAGPGLRTGQWRGRVLTFTAGDRSVRVTLTDWCACPGRLVDLSDDAFRQLAPLSRGLVLVMVASGPAPTLPATDGVMP